FRLADQFRKLFLQLRAPAFDVFNQERIAFDAGQNSRRDEIRGQTEQYRQNHNVERDHERRGQQSAAMTGAVHQENDSREHAEVQMDQQPVAQRARAPPIDGLANRISHGHRHADQTHEPRNPTHRQPRAAHRLVESVTPRRPSNYDRYRKHQQTRADMPGPGDRIALVNVASDGVRL